MPKLDLRTRVIGLSVVILLLLIGFISAFATWGAPPLLPRPLELQTWLRVALAALPAAMIGQHWLYVVKKRKKELPEQGVARPGVPGGHNPRELYFGRGQIAVRYLPPTLISFVGCYLLTSVLLWPGSYFPALENVTDNTALRAARFGFLGAYTYVVALLAQRGFKHDITGGVAMWSAVMLVLGPVTAGVLSVIQGDPGTEGTGSDGAVLAVTNWDIVAFGVGMIPREFIAFVQGAARQILRHGQQINPGRTVPLTTIRGIDPDAAERLYEEGITDVSALAFANPFLLMRSTNFERRQIVDWIDEALLIRTLPQAWEDLEKHAITGARRLADHHGDAAMISILAKVAKLEELELTSVANALDDDPHVKELRHLYDRPTGETVPSSEVWFGSRDGMADADVNAVLTQLRASGSVSGLEFTRPLGTITLKPGADVTAVTSVLTANGFSFLAPK